MKVDTDYPGGNSIVESIDGDEVRLRPDLRDTEGNWFWWNFRVRGAAGRRVLFRFAEDAGPCVGVRGPAVSRDGGKQWEWLGAEASGLPEKESFPFSFAQTDHEVRFAFAIPYQLADWEEFALSLPEDYIREVICRTRNGRAIPFLREDGNGKGPIILVTARHHACESMANFVMEGLVAAWKETLRDRARLAVIPFVDFDGVEAGDQGKNRHPRDHNRDYLGEPVYPEVAAIKKWVTALEGPFVGLDLHCPYARGLHNEDIYLVGSSDPEMASRQIAFSEEIETKAEGLPFAHGHFLPFGTAWNRGQNYHAGKSFARWCGEQPHCLLATTMEIPYANAGGTAVSPDRARLFGRSLAAALSRCL